ncbi:uncharacterized protein FTJAE_3054 [Fusarium tjaetaba]|uniref:Uncharacterized protein n=1 Tax=Fusarium tjaetaba TaxID=1567544 RepID=A0A8H5S357_9HYPO|nr:uncharacterized protein FTJAE_3054 [Fusarium tjaetaba]KAF5643755.1 hypothetical protein FTJAE_3054 [Fusarium tjaetaba]
METDDTPARADFSEELWALVCSIYEENEKISLETVEGIIGDAEPVIRDRWDQQSEDQMQAQWQTSLRKESSDVIGTRGNNDFHYRYLWRFCLRFLHQAPPIMLSPLNRLQFVPKRNRLLITSHLFTLDACLDLTQLVIHPIWEQNYRRFIDTLHYAATYRVGALRNFDWTFFDEDCCPALQILNDNLTAVEGPQLPHTVHELHVDARNAVVARGETPGVFSDLVCRIGELATVARFPSASERAQLTNGVVPFNGSDLEVMKKAIDSLAPTEPKIGYPVKAVYDAFKAAKGTADVLLRERLREFDERACKQFSETQEVTSQPASVPNSGRVARRPRNHQGSRYAPYSLFSRHPSRTGPSGGICRPQDSSIASDQRSMRQGHTTASNLVPAPHQAPGIPVSRDLRRPQQHRGVSPASDVDGSVVTDESASAHDVFSPPDNDATPQSPDPVERDSLAQPQVQTPGVVTSSQGLATDEVSQLRQENAQLSQEISNFKTEQAQLINDLKARLETRETETLKVSERLAKLEAELRNI